MASLLWVGPGLRKGASPWWDRAFVKLLIDDAELHLDRAKLIDVAGKPPSYFGEIVKSVETEQADFFEENDYWDIVILDFLEAWRLGEENWMGGRAEIPYKYILSRWEEKLNQLRPAQVWVRHDYSRYSSIRPNLEPDYEKVVETFSESWKPLSADPSITIMPYADYWSYEAAKGLASSGFEVWQRL